jgi:hypothetical protein
MTHADNPHAAEPEDSASQADGERELAGVLADATDTSELANPNSLRAFVETFHDREPPTTYVYAIGRIAPHFPNLGLEREFAQVLGQVASAGLTDADTMHRVFEDPVYRYIVRQLCWVMSIEGVETYIVEPDVAETTEALVASIPTSPNGSDINVVIGTLGDIAAPEMCNGLAFTSGACRPSVLV